MDLLELVFHIEGRFLDSNSWRNQDNTFRKSAENSSTYLAGGGGWGKGESLNPRYGRGVGDRGFLRL